MRSIGARCAALGVALAACGHVEGAVPEGPAATPEGLAIDGGNETQRAMLAFAIRRAEWVYRSPGFWALVAERPHWLRAPADDHDDGVAMILPADVGPKLALLHPTAGTYALVHGYHWYDPFPGGTNAETAVCGATRVARALIKTEAQLIGTIAHENTHRLGMGSGALGCDGPGAARYRFIDTPVDVSAKPWLVSYVIGDLALCYADADGDPARTRSCFAHTVNGDKACRVHEECCMPTKAQAVMEIRKQSSQCAPYADAKACERSATTCPD